MNTSNKKNQGCNDGFYKEIIKRIGGMDIRIKPISLSVINPLFLHKTWNMNEKENDLNRF